ncbi:MAG: hypothetical protein ACRDL7_11975, partial [Gaiellaceae bacterium]
YELSEAQQLAFSDDMEILFRTRCKGYGYNVAVGDVLRDVLKLIRKHQVRIDANYATLVINALCVEGLAHRVAPHYNLLDASKSLLRPFHRLGGTGRAKGMVRPFDEWKLVKSRYFDTDLLTLSTHSFFSRDEDCCSVPCCRFYIIRRDCGILRSFGGKR